MESDIAALLYALYFITQLLKPPVEGNVIFSDIKQKTKFLKWGGILGRFYVERKSYILEKYDNVLKSEVDIISKHV
ncbi:hypothetical protein HDE_08665 [Halotydeus destructor]|nr:hypothetical protein HDE_08665 [Halotydeus destructor]